MNVRETALALGFVEARPLRASLFEEAQSILPGARTLWVLLTAHTPYEESSWPEDALYTASHYPASQRAYRNTKILAERLREAGYRAEANPFLPAKTAAQRAGLGWMGRQELLHHPVYGSWVCIHLLLTDREETYEFYPVLPAPCAGCDLCVRACPTGAVTGDGHIRRELCLRNYMMEGRDYPGDMLEKLGKHLVGCEACQRACPHNRAVGSVSVPPELAEPLRLLCADDETIRRAAHTLSDMLGSNLMRPARLIKAVRQCRESLAARKEDQNGK